MDLVVLIFLIRKIVLEARSKNQKGLKWGLLLALNWFMFELVGTSFVAQFLNIKLDLEFFQKSPGYAILIGLFGIGCGYLGYLLTTKMLERSARIQNEN